MFIFLAILLFIISWAFGYLAVSVCSARGFQVKEYVLIIKAGILEIILIGMPFEVWKTAMTDFPFGKETLSVLMISGFLLGIMCRKKGWV